MPLTPLDRFILSLKSELKAKLSKEYPFGKTYAEGQRVYANFRRATLKIALQPKGIKFSRAQKSVTVSKDVVQALEIRHTKIENFLTIKDGYKPNWATVIELRGEISVLTDRSKEMIFITIKNR
jgi:hypothetical protein